MSLQLLLQLKILDLDVKCFKIFLKSKLIRYHLHSELRLSITGEDISPCAIHLAEVEVDLELEVVVAFLSMICTIRENIQEIAWKTFSLNNKWEFS